ncbi:MAG: gamma-glutamyl-gamma-aminobutyrate hydrolase family protein [Candidatus Aminicenantes bacterium]|jgi:putative glutamine amidotransferase
MALLKKTKKPLVFVSGPDRGGWAAWIFTRLAVWMAGGKARRITPARARAASFTDMEGLILGGGADIVAKSEAYDLDENNSEKKSLKKKSRGNFLKETFLEVFFYSVVYILRKLFSRKFTSVSDPGRDRLELKLIEQALGKNIPILGICRGMQLINFHLGGTLYEDISHFYQETTQIRTIFPRKRIYILPQTQLKKILHTSTCRVNALHHQAIKRLAQGMIGSAVEKNPIIQAIEHGSYPFLMGVQWHPEYMLHRPRQRWLFAAFVKACQQQ